MTDSITDSNNSLSFDINSEHELNSSNQESPFLNWLVQQNFIRKIYFIFSIQQFFSFALIYIILNV